MQIKGVVYSRSLKLEGRESEKREVSGAGAVEGRFELCGEENPVFGDFLALGV